MFLAVFFSIDSYIQTFFSRNSKIRPPAGPPPALLLAQEEHLPYCTVPYSTVQYCTVLYSTVVARATQLLRGLLNCRAGSWWVARVARGGSPQVGRDPLGATHPTERNGTEREREREERELENARRTRNQRTQG